MITNMARIRNFLKMGCEKKDVLCDLVKAEIDCIDLEMNELRKLGEKIKQNDCSKEMMQQNLQLMDEYSEIKQQLYDFYERINA